MRVASLLGLTGSASASIMPGMNSKHRPTSSFLLLRMARSSVTDVSSTRTAIVLLLLAISGCGRSTVELPTLTTLASVTESVLPVEDQPTGIHPTTPHLDSMGIALDHLAVTSSAIKPVGESASDMPVVSSTFDVRRLVGSWRDSFCGQRTLTLKADGSATMLLELDFAGRLLYGKRLEFDMRWSMNKSILTFEIVTGHPVDAARSAMKVWGEKFEYRLTQLDDEQMHGWARDDSTLYKLRREASSDSSAN